MSENEKDNGRAYLREASIKLRKRRVKDGTPVGEPMTDPELVYELFADLQNEGKEKLVVVALDVKLKIICFEVVAVGSVRAAYAKPAEIIRVPIAMGAQGIVLVHNHPSGDPTPSEPDRELTRRIKGYCDDLGMTICDHVIIGDGKYFSFSDEGILEDLAK